MAIKLSALEVSGDAKWFEFPDAEGVRFLIARWNNPEFRKMQRKLTMKERRRMRKDEEGVVIDRINKECAAYTILKDWEGLEQDNGKPLKFTPEKAMEVFYTESLAPIWDFVLTSANDSEEYRKEVYEESEKNL